MSQPPENPYANPTSTTQPLSPSDEKTWAILTHVLAIFFGFVSALVLFLLFKDRGPFVRAHVVTEWNFQLTITILDAIAFVAIFAGTFGSIAASASTGTSVPPSLGWFLGGYFFILLTYLFRLIFCIVAAVAANRGTFYRIPLAIRFVKA